MSSEPDPIGACCARCGYDLRGLSSPRCPECGAVLAEQRQLAGAIPWTFRSFRGRVRTFARTAADVARRASWVRTVLAMPVSMRDARRFWLAAVALVAAPLVVAFYAATWGRRTALLYVPDVVQDVARAGNSQITLPGWWDDSTLNQWIGVHAVALPPAWLLADGLWPLSVGWSRPGVGPLAIALAVLLGSGAASYCFHPRAGLDSARSRRLAAFGYYEIGATLAGAAPSLLFTLGALGWHIAHGGPRLGSAAMAFVLGALATFAALLLGFARMLRTIRRATGGPMPMLIAAIAMPTASALAVAFALVVVPWAIGYAWLLIDALG